MEKAKRRVRICLLCVVITAVIVGILYYYNELQNTPSQSEGTLITAVHMGWKNRWQ